MARRDGFRALSLSRKDGGAARGVPSAAAGDRKNLKTKCSTWRSIGGLRGPQKSKNQGIARGVPRAAPAKDRKNPKTKLSHTAARAAGNSPVCTQYCFCFIAFLPFQGATWSTAITPATGITRNKILESRLKTGDLGKVALLFGVTTENSAVSSSSVAKFEPEENLQQFQAR
ncbi:uncharacterized protein LOC144174512 isoform X1 [Haemaphysalis longicornis]